MGRKKLARANYLSFETFRKSGVGVATPVWFAEEEAQAPWWQSSYDFVSMWGARLVVVALIRGG